MSHFKQVMFTLSKVHDIYIDEVLLNDKKKEKRQFSNGRSEYIRKLIDDDINKENKYTPNPIKMTNFETGKSS